jgi:microsomal dipeptidase-like Zn-dependent dipeptidase
VIADLHCHYPMHLLGREYRSHRAGRSLLRRMSGELRARLLAWVAFLFNDPAWSWGWRVDLAGLQRGGVSIACSVLLWPTNEMAPAGTLPDPGSFEHLKKQLLFVEHHLARAGTATPHHVVRTLSDLDDAGDIAIVHCVEGGFHLGGDLGAIDAHVRWLADHGVAYITLAHLIFRDVATDAPAIPLFPDWAYNRLFPQPASGLTDLGVAAVEAMYRHSVLIDISHMSELAIDQTFHLVEQLDSKYGRRPAEFPVIATHVGVRAAGPGDQEYNLSERTMQRIGARGGVIGLIMAQHQLGTTWSKGRSRAVLHKHIEEIVRVTEGYESCAIGTDLDGFIKPTLTGIRRAPSLMRLEAWIRAAYPAQAHAILYDNARRVLRQAFAGRP